MRGATLSLGVWGLARAFGWEPSPIDVVNYVVGAIGLASFVELSFMHIEKLLRSTREGSNAGK